MSLFLAEGCRKSIGCTRTCLASGANGYLPPPGRRQTFGRAWHEQSTAPPAVFAALPGCGQIKGQRSTDDSSTPSLVIAEDTPTAQCSPAVDWTRKLVQKIESQHRACA